MGNVFNFEPCRLIKEIDKLSTEDLIILRE